MFKKRQMQPMYPMQAPAMMGPMQQGMAPQGMPQMMMPQMQMPQMGAPGAGMAPGGMPATGGVPGTNYDLVRLQTEIRENRRLISDLYQRVIRLENYLGIRNNETENPEKNLY